MFPLTEGILTDSTRRRICLALFVLLCAAPTLVVLTIGIRRWLPSHAATEAKRLSRLLGQEVSVDRVRHPRPNVVVYEGLTLADAETRQPVLRCARLECGPAADAEDGFALVAVQPRVQASGVEQLRRLAEEVLTRRLGEPDGGFWLAADRVVMAAGNCSLALTDLRISVKRLAHETQAEITFRVEGGQSANAMRVRVRRSHQSQPPATAFDLDTGGGALPCALLATAFEEFGPLGSEAWFRGRLGASQAADGVGGELAGEFLDVDLETLTADRPGQLLSGRALLTIQEARFEQGRLQAVLGSLNTSEPGMASYSLLEAAVSRLGFAPGITPNTAGALVPYDQLALSFYLDADGLRVRGDCRPSGSGAILVSPQGVLLAQPQVQPQPVAAMVRALVPGEEIQVPISEHAHRLMRRLPWTNAQARGQGESGAVIEAQVPAAGSSPPR